MNRCHLILTSVKGGAQAIDVEVWPPSRLLSLALGTGYRILGRFLDQWPDVVDVGGRVCAWPGVSGPGFLCLSSAHMSSLPLGI